MSFVHEHSWRSKCLIRLPTAYPSDQQVVAYFVQSITLLHWDYSGRFVTFEKGSSHILPRSWAEELANQGYCYFVEIIK